MGSRRLPLLLVPLLASLARAQPAGPDLNLLALSWSLGEYRAPLVCVIDGEPRRGLRRVLVTPGHRHARPPVNRIQLFDLEIPDGTRCTTDTGMPQPNASGGLMVTLEGISRPDTAQHDFTNLLRREGGVSFRIRSGRLRLTPAETSPGPLREVDFSGGTARFTVVKRGSDAYRRLADFGARRKLGLALAAPDGTRLELDLVQYGKR